MFTDVGSYVFFVTIKCIDKKTRNLIEFLEWQDMRFEIRSKWDWYFTYRAALLQVKYPKAIVELNHGKTIPTGTQLEISRRNRLRAKKAKISEVENKLAKARLNWIDLFPIEENVLYMKATAKLNRLKAELAIMELGDLLQRIEQYHPKKKNL